MKYTENYYNLSHGTDMISAQNIYQNGLCLCFLLFEVRLH